MTQKSNRCRRCGKPYTSLAHMKQCKGMSIQQRNAARAHRAAGRRAARARYGAFFASSPVSASYFDDARKEEVAHAE